MRRYLVPAVAAVAAAAGTAALAGADDHRDATHDHGRAYDIGFWGDVPYSDVQIAQGVPNLVADMNRHRLAFTVHDGDIKAGGTRCDDAVYTQFEGYLNALEAPALTMTFAIHTDPKMIVDPKSG